VHSLRIVCPVDFSDCSRRALRFAGALAAHFGTRLSIVHIADPFLAGAVVSHELDLLADDGQGELRQFVADNLRPQPAKGLEPEIRLIVGAPAREIISFAAQRQADLIVMGTHGYSGARKTYFGSTAEYVLGHSGVPVLTIPLATTREAEVVAPLIGSGPVIAPVDFSVESYAAAHAAAGLARALDLRLLLLHVDGDHPVDGAHLLLRDLAQSLEHYMPVEARIERGNPGAEIAAVARQEHASVVVLSLATATTQARNRPGSVAYKVLCQAPTPILALPVTDSGHVLITYLHRRSELTGVSRS
jgi:nucleotide-binding universal stress UspA family protein